MPYNIEDLRDAITEHNKDLVSEILTENQDLVNQRVAAKNCINSPLGFSPLVFAIKQSTQEIVNILLSNGADKNQDHSMAGNIMLPADFLVNGIALDGRSERMHNDCSPTDSLPNEDLDMLEHIVGLGANMTYKDQLSGEVRKAFNRGIEARPNTEHVDRIIEERSRSSSEASLRGLL